MKKLILIFLLLTSVVSFSQTDSLVLEEKKLQQQDIIIKSSIGFGLHSLSVLHLINGNKNDPSTYNTFLFYNSIGLFFDVLAIIDLFQYKQFKIENNLLKDSYN